MSIDLYQMPLSSPCRAIRMAARAVGVKLNLKETDIMSGANRTPEYLKMNPQHTIPTLDDNGFYMNESRAVLQYLVNKYGGPDGDKLYPKEPVARARVDMKLYFDMGTLYFRFGDVYYPSIFTKVPLDEGKLEKLDEALGFLEVYVKDGAYVAGDHLTIADIAIAATLSTIESVGHDLSKFPKVVAYFQKLKEEIEDYQELNGDGAASFGAWAKTALGR